MAKICMVSTETIRRWIDKGAIRSVKTLGGHRRILVQDFFEFLTKNKIPYDRRLFDEKRKVLIVDDDSGVVELLKRFIGKLEEEFEVDSAENGFAAGQKVLANEPDIIFLDLIMPGMDGFEVCKNIKNNPRTKDVKVIAVTGYPTEDNLQKIKDCGATATLIKPFVFAQFEDAINALD